MRVIPGPIFVVLWLMGLPCQPAQAEPLDSFRDCPVCPEMIELPTGSFMMGAPEDEFRTIAYVGVNDEGRLAQLFATAEDPYVPSIEGPQSIVAADLRRNWIGRPSGPVLHFSRRIRLEVSFLPPPISCTSL